MFADQYEEHLAHSAPCSSRWDGFDRGDLGREEPRVVETVIGRMTNGAGQRVVITCNTVEYSDFYTVLVDGECVFFEEDDRTGAIRVARQWMNGRQA